MIRKRLITISAVLLVLIMLAVYAPKIVRPIAAEQADTAPQENTKYNAKSALLIDYDSGEVLFSQNPDQRLQIASMVKIMTLNIIFTQLKAGAFTLDTQIPVSTNASGMGGSQAFLDANVSYKADELIKSIIVASANDSCVAMAEFIAGDVESFVSKMNDKARELGMTNTNFANCTGLPDVNGYSTANDVAIMFKQLISHKEFFEYAKVWMYDIVHPGGRTTTLTNTNKLVRFYNGCDGGKTGFTKEALSCLAATAKRGNMRVIGVIICAPDAKQRNAEVSKLFNYGFANFNVQKIVDKDTPIEQRGNVENSNTQSIEVEPIRSYAKLTKKGEKASYQTKLELNELKAPIKKGEVVGRIIILKDDNQVDTVDVIAKEDAKPISYLDIINRMISGW